MKSFAASGRAKRVFIAQRLDFLPYFCYNITIETKRKGGNAVSRIYQLTKKIREVTSIPKKTVCALGLFDGVHLGHRALLTQTVQTADALCATPIVWCLHSAAYKGAKDLCSLKEKLTQFAALGIQYAVVEEFDAICHLSPEAFVSDIVLGQLDALCVLCGSDFRFGHRGAGTASLLASLMTSHGRSAKEVEKLCDPESGTVISASVIRQAIANGNLERANALLGTPYTIEGTVHEGKRLGRKIGFPTANLLPPNEKLLPPFGVYVCRARLEDGRVLGGVCNIGKNPTTDQLLIPRLEIHLFCDEMPDLYGQVLQVQLLHLIRFERAFDSIDALKEEIARNVASAKAYLQ
jgi:riboflavin kinase/FMN adenylyltransferase